MKNLKKSKEREKNQGKNKIAQKGRSPGTFLVRETSFWDGACGRRESHVCQENKYKN